MIISIIANKMINNQTITRSELETIIFETLNRLISKYKLEVPYRIGPRLSSMSDNYVINNVNRSSSELYFEEDIIKVLQIGSPPYNKMKNNLVKLLYYLCHETYFFIQRAYIKDLKSINIYSLYYGLENIIKNEYYEYYVQNYNGFISETEADLFACIETSELLKEHNDIKNHKILKNRAHELRKIYRYGTLTPFYKRNSCLRNLYSNIRFLESESDIVIGPRISMRRQLFRVVGELIKSSSTAHNYFEANLIFNENGTLKNQEELAMSLKKKKSEINDKKLLKEFSKFSKILISDIKKYHTLNYSSVNELRLNQISNKKIKFKLF